MFGADVSVRQTDAVVEVERTVAELKLSATVPGPGARAPTQGLLLSCTLESRQTQLK